MLFVGKLLVSKGVDLLAAAWPLIHRERDGRPGRASPRLLFIGFGAFEAGLRMLVDALDAGGPRRRPRGGRRGAAAWREMRTRPSRSSPASWRTRRRATPTPPATAAGSMLIGGRLEHDEVADVMPAAETFAMPSTWPEAFGMVPAESAACGVPPVAADHSGMREVAELLAEAVEPELARLLSFPVELGRRHRARRPPRGLAGARAASGAARRAWRWRSASTSSGAGRASPGPSSPPRGASWRACRR